MPTGVRCVAFQESASRSHDGASGQRRRITDVSRQQTACKRIRAALSDGTGRGGRQGRRRIEADKHRCLERANGGGGGACVGRRAGPCLTRSKRRRDLPSKTSGQSCSVYVVLARNGYRALARIRRCECRCVHHERRHADSTTMLRYR